MIAAAKGAGVRRREGLALHAHHLLQRVHDLHEVALGGHHRVDVLVGSGGLVDHLDERADGLDDLRQQHATPRDHARRDGRATGAPSVSVPAMGAIWWAR